MTSTMLSPAATFRTSFEYRLFAWIRANNVLLYASRNPMCDYVSLKESFAYFGQGRFPYARDWLSENLNRGWFVKKFAGGAHVAVVKAVRNAFHNWDFLTKTEDEPTNEMWTSFLQLPGMSQVLFESFAMAEIGLRWLPRKLGKLAGVSAKFTVEHVLELTFMTGTVSNSRTKRFDPPQVDGLTVLQQFEAFDTYHASVMRYLEIEIRTESNWPTEAECRRIETYQVTSMVEKLIKDLPPADLALFKKHADVLHAVMKANF